MLRGCLTVQFQSLLHQGISLLGAVFARRQNRPPHSFNPFFIRASVYCDWAQRGKRCSRNVSIPSSSGHQFTGSSNSLITSFHASVSIPSSSGHQFTVSPATIGIRYGDGVSIPSSSGHQFTDKRTTHSGPSLRPVSIPSSSGHQFTGTGL